ncbi:hypothetical protein EVAR_42601_1 [Eumeta japonica]|uniref:Uncharacterized protein n=1 Tax=Eumeta variegata TaxID=151549 RepID=A0A4C1XLK3_EUMVA|nr:hypothetical protein EVAR_42601_1 [Eumeta japonica]
MRFSVRVRKCHIDTDLLLGNRPVPRESWSRSVFRRLRCEPQKRRFPTLFIFSRHKARDYARRTSKGEPRRRLHKQAYHRSIYTVSLR